jgi:hypothetical protein
VALGIRKLQQLVTDTCRQNTGNLLEAFGEVFLRNVRFYIYPALPTRDEQAGEGGYMNAASLETPPSIHFLYQYLLDNGNIRDIEGFNPEVLNIRHKEVLSMIQTGQDWLGKHGSARSGNADQGKGLFPFMTFCTLPR